MPQVQLPIFPHGTTHINTELAFQRQADQIVYLNGHLPVFTHGASDLASFRLFTTQLIINGTASYGQIAKAFGVPLRTLKRYSQRYRERGAEVFFKPGEKRHGHRLTPERLAQVQELLEEGLGVPQISQQLGVLSTTLHKAIDSGRLRVSKKKRFPAR
jgi:transposase